MLDRSATLPLQHGPVDRWLQGHVPEGIIHLQATGKKGFGYSGGLVKQAGSSSTQGRCGRLGEGGQNRLTQFGFRFFR